MPILSPRCIKNLCITLHLALYISFSASVDSTNCSLCSTVIYIGKNSHISGPCSSRVLFKGQLYCVFKYPFLDSHFGLDLLETLASMLAPNSQSNQNTQSCLFEDVGFITHPGFNKPLHRHLTGPPIAALLPLGEWL